ncbi:MAG TPA: hypothetical protein VLY63_25765 [Anaerolineae bacterium]|nr:hypothetical protein [Anaerolineae bacterium]
MEEIALRFQGIKKTLVFEPAGRRLGATADVALWIGTAVLLGWFVYFAASTLLMPYPIEYREGASQVLTQFLLQKENPFLLRNQPLGMSNYGIGYPLAVLPFAVRFGNTLLVHRAVTLAFLFLSFVLVAWVLFKATSKANVAILGAVLTTIGLTGLGGLGAFPDSMGAFLFLAALLVPKIRDFDVGSLVFSALLCVAALLTKPYFLLAHGLVATYLVLFVSPKRAFLYGGLFLGLILLTAVLARPISGVYWIATLLGNWSNLSRSGRHLVVQLAEAFREYGPALLLAALVILARALRGRSAPADAVNAPQPLSRLRHWRKLDQPLLPWSVSFVAFALALSFLAFVVALGWHVGNYMTYIYQLQAPLLLVWLLSAIPFGSRLRIIAVPLLLWQGLGLCETLLNPSFLAQRESVSWKALYSEVQASESILNSPVITSRMIELGLEPVDSGQTEYFYNLQPRPDPGLLGADYDDIRERGRGYISQILHNVRFRKYDALVMTENQGLIAGPEMLETIGLHYAPSSALTVDMPQTYQQWRIVVWRPLSRPAEMHKGH